MTESESDIGLFTLDKQGILSAVTALCGPDRPLSEKLRKMFGRVLAATDWSVEIPRIEQKGINAKHFSGPLSDALTHSGDIVLLRDAAGFRLLHFCEQRWQYLSANGEPLSGKIDFDTDEIVEAIVITLPKEKDKSAGFSSLVALWPELKAAWAEVGIASLFVNSGQLLLPVFALLIYDKIALNGLFETLWALVFGMALYLATDVGMRLIRAWTTERISVDLAQRSDEKLWSRMVAQADLPPGGFPRFLSHYRDLSQTRDFVSSSYLLQVADIPFLALYLLVIGIIAWQMMIVVLVLVLLYAGLGFALQSRQTRLNKEAEQVSIQKLAFMGESLNSLDVVRTTPGSSIFLRSWRKLSEQATDADTKRRLAANQTAMFSTLMQTATTVIVLTAGVYLIHAQLMSIGMLIACNILAGRAMAQVASLFSVLGKWEDFMRAAERMETSLEDVAGKVCTPRPDIEGRVSVISVGKEFEDRPPALEDVSFTIAPGERIALLGRPGAGKSTLLRCLGGLSRADVGQIMIDGLEIEDIARFDRVKWLAYKGQDPAIFAGTLEDNLRISGCADQQRFQEAIWASGLENEFKSGRMSLGMNLEERGSNLSGGQRQKVALARAFAQPSRIMLLDEPTLGLDPESERLLSERLPKLLDPTDILLMTTHSPIMLNIVQRVIALDGGKIVADGPREKLVTLHTDKSSASAESAI